MNKPSSKQQKIKVLASEAAEAAEAATETATEPATEPMAKVIDSEFPPISSLFLKAATRSLFSISTKENSKFRSNAFEAGFSGVAEASGRIFCKDPFSSSWRQAGRPKTTA